MTFQEPVVTVRLPLFVWLIGSIFGWLLKATLFAILVIGAVAVLVVTSPYWITKRLRNRRGRT